MERVYRGGVGGYLIGLLDKGVIARSFAGRHRRIRAEDVFAYKAAGDADLL